MAQIIINENNIVAEYVKIGRLTGAIDIDVLPSDIERNKYKYVDGEFVLNPEYVAPNPVSIARIRELKNKLAETDYAIIKIAEGVATASEYSSVITQRQAWREEINRLEQRG